MALSSTLDRLHLEAKQNKWLRYFAVFNRIALAAGFIPSGFVKIFGERFTSLSVNHPMGQYLEALYHTGFYYTFIGVLQVSAAILLLIPRTATLGALLYFPIILNIFILTIAVRFDGSLFTSPLMVLANLYLICWDYDRLKYIFPFRLPGKNRVLPNQKKYNNKFPTLFFAGVVAIVIIIPLAISKIYNIKPHNTLNDCNRQCSTKSCNDFCNCIHLEGLSLDSCLEVYNRH